MIHTFINGANNANGATIFRLLDVTGNLDTLFMGRRRLQQSHANREILSRFQGGIQGVLELKPVTFQNMSFQEIKGIINLHGIGQQKLGCLLGPINLPRCHVKGPEAAGRNIHHHLEEFIFFHQVLLEITGRQGTCGRRRNQVHIIAHLAAATNNGESVCNGDNNQEDVSHGIRNNKGYVMGTLDDFRDKCSKENPCKQEQESQDLLFVKQTHL